MVCVCVRSSLVRPRGLGVILWIVCATQESKDQTAEVGGGVVNGMTSDVVTVDVLQEGCHISSQGIPLMYIIILSRSLWLMLWYC